MEATLHKLFNTASFEEVPPESVRDMANTYPYFSTLQFLLSAKEKKSQGPAFEKQYQKTLLYFQNPLWLKEQLNGWKDKQAQPENESPKEESQAELLQSDPSENVTYQDESESGPEEEAPELNITYQGPEKTDLGLSEDIKSNEQEKQAMHQAEVQKEELPIFQAYHTVDYFASQGIKISADLLQQDKLGKQLKSFTEWLRTMKRLPSTANEKQADVSTDPRILRFAETSLQEREVVTEAMAEVLLKQGKTEKAIDIYHKLSLLNPHKSAYFAARIEALKAV